MPITLAADNAAGRSSSAMRIARRSLLVIVAAIIATLFLHSAYEILRSARTELRELSTVPGQ